MNTEGNWEQMREGCSQQMAFKTKLERALQSSQVMATIIFLEKHQSKCYKIIT